MQKWANWIILGVKYIDNRRYYKLNNETLNYEAALEKTGLVPLSDRREILTSKFALQIINSERHQSMFQVKHKKIQTRSNALFQEERYYSERFRNSSVPYMTRLLNNVLWTK